ncbi:MAG TPA: glutamate mutase L, partial [Ktedonobacterales bacterium]
SRGQILTPEQGDGDGVDAFVVSLSAGGPLIVAMIATALTSPDVEISKDEQALAETARRAVAGVYADVELMTLPPAELASSGPNGGPDLQWLLQIEHLRRLNPRALLLAESGGTPSRYAPEVIKSLSLVLKELVNSQPENSTTAGVSFSRATLKLPVFHPTDRLPIVYTGSPEASEHLRQELGPQAEVRQTEPFTPQHLAPLSAAISLLHERQMLNTLAGYHRLNGWMSAPPMATATSFSSLIRFLARQYGMNVVGVDVGGSATSVMIAGEHGEFLPSVHATAGVASGLGSILRSVGVAQVARWLSFEVSEQEIRQFVLEKMIQPHLLPYTERELEIEHALTREAILLALGQPGMELESLPNLDLILGAGGVLAHVPHYGQAALLLLDTIQPRGISSLVLDTVTLAPQLGVVAVVDPIAAVQATENDAVLQRLGTVVSAFGHAEDGEPALRLQLDYLDGRKKTLEVAYGSLEVVPLTANEQAMLTLFPSKTIDVGLGPGEQARAGEAIEGGIIGLIIDARGRPLRLPDDPTYRRAKLAQWRQAIGA